MMDRVRTLRDEMEQKLSEARQSEGGKSGRLTLEIASKRRQINKYLVEIHKKYAIPIACIVFVLIGAPIGYHLKRGGLGIGMGVSIGFFLLYYLGLRTGEGIADRGIVSAWLSMWLPNIIIGGVGALLFYATNAGLGIRFWRSE
jgi:lipopolysaccharide export system permease protein